jgi:multidrug efflux system outer membrane protein
VRYVAQASCLRVLAAFLPPVAIFALLIFIFTGCAVGPNYKRPDVSAPPAFRDATETATNSLGDLPWWQIFEDDALQELIRAALTNNYDVRIAVARVEQARAIANLSRTAFYPEFDYDFSAGRGKNAANGFPVTNHKTQNFFFGDASVSWELDLWGRIRRLNEEAQAQYLASQEARRDVRISIISQVAQAYFELIALDAQLEIARRATNAFGESLRIFSDRRQHGVASRLETSAAEALQATAAGDIPEIERRITLKENQINVLLGRYVGPVPRNRVTLEQVASIPEIPAGLPSSLLERRPDIREAEQQLRAANAQVGVAIANFFPQLSLTAMFGRISPELTGVTGGSANAWSIAANLAGPIFHGGQLVAQKRQAQAIRSQFALEYGATVLTAFREVSDALISRERYAEAIVQQKRAVQAYEQAVGVAVERYRLGQSSYYEVLQEQQLLYPAENTLVLTAMNQLVNTVQLYRALGGGWK